MIAYHEDQDSLATIVCHKVENIQEKGMMVIDENNRIIAFKEKPSLHEIVSDYATCGIYVFKTKILDQLSPLTNKKKILDFGRDVFPFMLENNLPMLSYKLTGWLLDIGNPANYRVANEKINNLKSNS